MTEIYNKNIIINSPKYLTSNRWNTECKTRLNNCSQFRRNYDSYTSMMML